MRLPKLKVKHIFWGIILLFVISINYYSLVELELYSSTLIPYKYKGIEELIIVISIFSQIILLIILFFLLLDTLINLYEKYWDTYIN